MSDQDRILSSQCQYNIKQTSDESNENTIRGILVYPLPNFSNQYHNIVTENPCWRESQ